MKGAVKNFDTVYTGNDLEEIKEVMKLKPKVFVNQI